MFVLIVFLRPSTIRLLSNLHDVQEFSMMMIYLWREKDAYGGIIDPPLKDRCRVLLVHLFSANMDMLT